MKYIAVLLVLALAILGCAATSNEDNPWVGTYEDEIFGGVVEICIRSGDLLYGSYSRIGLLVGKTKGLRATGHFYETNVIGRECAYGTFDLFLSDDYQEFNGTYTCADTKAVFDWHGALFADEEPLASNCAVLRPRGTAAGTWTTATGEDTWSVCVKDNAAKNIYSDLFFFTSFTDEEGIKAYAQGYAFEQDGLVLSGYFYDEEGNTGGLLAFKREDGNLGIFYAETNDLSEGNLSPYNPYIADDSTFDYIVLKSKPEDSAQPRDCEINERFISAASLYFPELAEPLSSGAVAVSFSLAMLALIAVALF